MLNRILFPTISIFIFLIAVHSACGYDRFSFNRENDGFGMYFMGNYNQYSADFSQLPLIPSCCERYDIGGGYGYSFGILFDVTISNGLLLSLRSGYNFLNGGFVENEFKTIILEDEIVGAVIQHQLDARIQTVTLEPLLQFKLLSDFSLLSGLSIGYFMKKEFEQRELLIKPEDYGTFENGQRIRLDYNGTIPNSSDFLVGIVAGLKYDIREFIWDKLILSPEILISYGLTSVLKEDKWNIINIRFGFATKIMGDYEIDNPIESFD